MSVNKRGLAAGVFMKLSYMWNMVLDRMHILNGPKPQRMDDYMQDRFRDTWPFVCFLRNGMVVKFEHAYTEWSPDAIELHGITAILMPNGKVLEYPKHKAGAAGRLCVGETLTESIESSLFHGNRGMVVRLSEIVAICEGDS